MFHHIPSWVDKYTSANSTDIFTHTIRCLVFINGYGNKVAYDENQGVCLATTFG
jgi:hypothetical protein